MEDLRELSRRSIRAQGASLLAAVGALLVTPIVLLVGAGPWTLVPLFLAAGALFVHAAWRAGEARGAFRRVFARVKAERRASRHLVPAEPADPARAARPPKP